MSEDDKTTKPTIETVLEKINALGQQMVEMREMIIELRTDLRIGLKGVERKIGVLNDNMLTLQADQRDLESRVEKLEPKAP